MSNQKMIRFLLFFCISTVFMACDSANLLTYKYKKYYKESNTIANDSVFEANQSVCYHKPRVADGGFCSSLSLRFIDTAAAKTKKVLDLQTDTAIVRANYDFNSVWSWDAPSSKITGQIEILKWHKNKLVLKENVQVFLRSKKQIKKFVGIRIFIRDKE